MRFAALAFGIVAGLVASLVLALGGLDLNLLAIDQRQLAGVRFGLFVVANLGIFGAGLVLAAPLAAAALFALGALAWIGAAILLHHGPDMVMLVPPGLLIIAGAVALVAGLRRRAAPLPPLAPSSRRDTQARRIDQDADDVEPVSLRTMPARQSFEELPPIAVGAGFFGDSGTANPPRSAAPSLDPRDDLAEDNEPDPEPEQQPRFAAADWRPGRKRPPPPRTRDVFREIEDDDDGEPAEGGVSRVARGISTLLSFGLYAALAGAAILVFFNLRTTDPAQNTATKVELSSRASTATARPLPSQPPAASSVAPPRAAIASTTPPALPNATTSVAALPDLSTVSSASQPAIDSFPGVVVAGDPSDVPSVAPSVVPAATPASASSAPAAADASDASAEFPAATTGDQNVVMPWPVPSQLAAERAKPAPRRPVQNTAPATPALNTTGL